MRSKWAFASGAWAALGSVAVLSVLLAGLAVVLWTLYPVFFHAHVGVPPPSTQTVQALRSAPDEATLAELAAQRPLGASLPPGRDAVVLAERWLALYRDQGAADSHPIAPSIDPAELGQDKGVGALPFNSLFGADVLVQAFRASGDARYLGTARDLILGYARFERTAWRARSFLWNDHAIAARAGVIIRFWASYRAHPMFAPGDAAEILQHAARSAELLAMRSHFTAWSNHGVMQNIALLQLAAAFPGLVDGPSLSQTAFERLALQWRYYISAEGVVLEHSAGYHLEGLSLLKLALRGLELNRLAAPPQWREQLRLAEDFLARLTRPDGTLPGYGDTRVQVAAASWTQTQTQAASEAASESGALKTYPLSGYAVWSAAAASGAAGSHSVATWSYFPGLAHKHADETALVLWAGGRGWITPSGYAPYASVYRQPVEGWLGSNAPHGENERADPARRAALLGAASSPLSVLVDVQRRAPDGVGYRRQIVSLADRLWLVIDQPLGAAPWPTTETLWTFYPDLSLAPRGDGRFVLRDPKGLAMSVAITAGGGAPQASIHAGSRQPFAGWLATDEGVVSAPALRVLAPSGGWTATVFDTRRSAAAVAVRLTDGENWQAEGDDWTMRREGARLLVRLGEQQAVASVVAPADMTAQRNAIDQGLKAALSAYPKYRNVDEYRLRMASWLGALWAAQTLAYFALRRWLRRQGWTTAVQAMIALFWGGVAIWLGTVYFAG